MDSSPPGSSIHGIFQARILEWVAISFSRRSSLPRDWTQVSRIAGRFFTNWATRDENKKTTGGKVIKLKYQSYVLTNRKSEKKKEKKDRNGEQNYQREEKKNTFQSWRMGILWGQSCWVYTLWIKKKQQHPHEGILWILELHGEKHPKMFQCSTAGYAQSLSNHTGITIAVLT